MRTEVSRTIIHDLAKLHRLAPHVAAKIEVAWGTEQAHMYFKKLLNKDRDERKGFEFDVFQLIMKLYLIHVMEYSDFNCLLVINDHANIASLLR
jgi:hypothetical protein